MFELARFQQENFCFQTISVLQLEKATEIHSSRRGVSFIKTICSYFEECTAVLKQYDKAVKFPLYHLLKPKQEIGFTFSKEEPFAHCFQDIKKHCKRQIRLSICSERNKECCFSVKKFQIFGEQNVLIEIINLRHCEVYSLHKLCYYVASKWGLFDSKYALWLNCSCSSTSARSNYSGNRRRYELSKEVM